MIGGHWQDTGTCIAVWLPRALSSSGQKANERTPGPDRAALAECTIVPLSPFRSASAFSIAPMAATRC